MAREASAAALLDRAQLAQHLFDIGTLVMIKRMERVDDTLHLIAQGHRVAVLRHLSCPSATSCFATGRTTDNQGVLVPITNGVAGPAQVVAGTNYLVDIACPSPSTMAGKTSGSAVTKAWSARVAAHAVLKDQLPVP